jgi:hypothetical protein
MPQTETDSLMDNAARILRGEPVKLNEVTVVLPPPGSELAPAEDTAEEPSENQDDSPATDDADVAETDVETPEVEQDSEDVAMLDEAPEEAPQAPEPGLAVRVERLQSGSGGIDPSQVKLLAPFPAKLLARTPEGWRIEASKQAPPITRDVELAPGKNITLTIRPHLLVADADGSTVFQVAEPGFDAPLGYRQDATVGAILSNSIRQLEDDSLQLGSAIENLQQLLVSLPQPESVPDPESESQSANKPKR